MAAVQHSFGIDDSPVERRSVRRRVVDCEARLRTASGDRMGRLTDLSETGARFEAECPPPAGTSVMLSWGNHEFFGQVMWTKEASCGLLFERAIASWVVEDTAHAVEESSAPVANFGRIPLGEKRSRRFTLVSGEQS